MLDDNALVQVRVCRFCGHINTGNSSRCNNCWLGLAGISAVGEAEGRRLAQLHRLRYLRSRILRLSLLLALAIGLTAWGVLTFFELGLPPSKPTTRVSATTGPGAWAQAGRTLENTSFIPHSGAPAPAEVKWTFETSKAIFSSPTIVGDRVYVTTEDGRALALDRETGRKAWDFPTGVISDSSPAVAGDLVFFGLRDSRFIALDRETGVQRWERDLGNPVFASPIVLDGTVYVGSADKRIYALDAATGRKLWSFKTEGWITSRVAYADDKIAVTSQNKVLHIIDTKSGRKRFVYDAGWPIAGAPAIREGKVYFAANNGTVWAVNLDTITYPFERAWWTFQLNLFAWGIIDDVAQQKGTVWGNNIGGRVSAGPAIAHDRVYLARRNGRVVALDADKGDELWSQNLGTIITAQPVVAGGTVLIGTRYGALFGLDAFTGEKLWVFETGGEISASPVVVGNMMFVASHDGKLYAARMSE